MRNQFKLFNITPPPCKKIRDDTTILYPGLISLEARQPRREDEDNTGVGRLLPAAGKVYAQSYHRIMLRGGLRDMTILYHVPFFGGHSVYKLQIQNIGIKLIKLIYD
mgnify:CR=1 FL=1